MIIALLLSLVSSNAHAMSYFDNVTIEESCIMPALTASKVVIIDGSHNIMSSSTNSSELAFLDATSSIQTQLNSKQNTLTLGNLTTSPTTNITVTGGTGAIVGSGATLNIVGASIVESTSSVLALTGATNAVLGTGVSIQVKQAATSQSGYLSSTDWNTFNGKQGALTLTTTGSSGAATLSGNTLNIPQYSGGGGSGNVSNGGNSFGSTMSVGTSDNQEFDLLGDTIPVLRINPNGTSYPILTVGTQAQNDNNETDQYFFYSGSNGSGKNKDFVGFQAESVIGDTTDGSGYQEGIHGFVHSDANSGTYALLRNYFMAEADGNATITETYGARALTRIFDNNYPTQVSTGTITNGYGLEAYAHSTSHTAVMKNATGILISHANAGNADGTTVDSDPETAIGLHIQEDIAATGSSTMNLSYAILSDSTTAPIQFNSELELENHADLRLSDENFHYITLNAPASMAGTIGFTLPGTIGSANNCMQNGGTAGVLQMGACVTSRGPGTYSLAFNGGTKTISAGSGVTITDASGDLSISASGGGGGGDVNFGGNSKGSNETIGLTDAFELSLITNNTNRLNITSGGISTFGGQVSDFTSAPVVFGVHDFHTVDDNNPENAFDSFFAYYGDSSNSKDGTSFSYNLRPGETFHTYSGEYNGFVSKAFVGSAGSVSDLASFKAITSVTNGSGILEFGYGASLGVLTSAGVVINATGIDIPDVQAEGSTSSNHAAIGIDLCSNGGCVASGSSGTNSAIGMHIGTVTGDSGIAWAIKSDSTAAASFAGGVQVNTSTSQPTCSSTTRGTFWVIQGAGGVADIFQVCLKSALDVYAWITK